MPEDYSIRSVLRALNIIEVLNSHNGASLTDVIALTGLSRGTAYRILETLRCAQYVSREGRGGYWLSGKVCTLSDGYHEDSWVHEIAQPRMDALGKQVGWPLSLATALGTHVLVRATVESALTFVHISVGTRFPMIETAAGYVHLAFATSRERGLLLDLIHRSAPDKKLAARGIAAFNKALGGLQANGYALVSLSAKYMNCAVPIFSRRRPIGSLVMRFPTNALRKTDIEEGYVDALRKCARDIGLAFDAAAPERS